MRRIIGWLGLAMVMVALGVGCAGIFSENVREDGSAERFRLGTGSKWSSWDHSNAKQDDMCIMFRKESTF